MINNQITQKKMSSIGKIVKVLPGLIIVMMLVTACAQTTPTTLPTPTNLPTLPTSTAVDTATPDEMAVAAAKSLLAGKLNVTSTDIQLKDVQTVEWPDSCLGVPQAGIMCAMHVVSGYRVILTANDQTYEVHSNLDGSQALLVPGVVPTTAGLSFTTTKNDQCQTTLFTLNEDALSGQCYVVLNSKPMVEKTRNDELNHFVTEFKSFSADTSNGFLNFYGTGDIQASAIDQRSIAAWAQIVSNEIQGGQSSASEGLVLSWHRKGGIAGFCDDLSVYASGAVNATSCKSGQTTDLGKSWLTSDQLNQIYQWLDKFGGFEYQSNNEQATADAMTIDLIFNGQGNTLAPRTDQQTIETFASQVFSENLGSGSSANTSDPKKVVTDFLNSYKSDGTGKNGVKFLSSSLQAAVQSGSSLPDLIGIQNTYLSFGITSTISVAGSDQVIVEAGLNLVSPIDRYFAMVKEDGEWKINAFIQHAVPAMSTQTEYVAADQVILAYIQAMQNKDSAAEWNLLTPETQTNLSQSDLTKESKGLQTIQPIKISMDSNQTEKLTYTVDLWINIATDPVIGWVEGLNTRTFTMLKVNGNWRIDQIAPVN